MNVLLIIIFDPTNHKEKKSFGAAQEQTRVRDCFTGDERRRSPADMEPKSNRAPILFYSDCDGHTGGRLACSKGLKVS